ncbi:MAG: GLPGLI family protein [Proteiniphilum sp.]|nr:GLPGLI family protein [Proteiniphilum sp.]
MVGNAGPWKFSGLPGLIMSIQDTKGHYTFEISGLENTREPIEYIEYGARKYTRTDRITFLRTNAKASNIGWVRYLEANSPKKNESDFIPASGGARYNFLERDF